MPVSLWSIDIIAILAVVSITAAAIGYLIAGRKTASFAQQLSHVETEFARLQQNHEQLQEQWQAAQDCVHQHEIKQSRQEQQLVNFQATERRLSEELEELASAHQTVKERYSRLNEQMHAVDKQLESAQADNRAYARQVEELRDNLHEQKSFYDTLTTQHQQLTKEHTELKTTLEKREQHYQEQMQQLADTRQSLTKEFENLAHKIFEEKGKSFSQTSQTSMDTLLKPFREQIEGFQKRVNEVHESSIRGNSHLTAEIQKVLEIGLKMSNEATNLASALKGDSQQRGAWGEAQLRRTLEMSGLIEDAHYEVQSAFKDDQGKSKQTDYLIKLPDGKHIIIDSKVSLNAYDRAVAAQAPEEYQLAMNDHIKAVRRHIDDLASKDYTNLVGMRSPSFVLMFMPIEPAYIEALKNNKDLFDYGYRKNIVLVSHTTLIPILRTVSNLWMVERSNMEAREISEKAGEIYNQVCIVAEHLNRLGGTLGTVSNHYNRAVTALAGQQGLYGKVERFNTLSSKVSKTLPVLEPSHQDFENERLSLIVQAIDEEPAKESSLPTECNTVSHS